MKLLYFATIDFFAKPNPGFHLMYSMIQDLLSNGVEIFYVGCSLEEVDKHIPSDLEENSNFHYDLVTVKSIPKSNFVHRYIDGINYALKAKKKISKCIKRCDLVFVQSSPTVFYNIHVVRKLSKSIKIIYNIQDMFPGSSIASGVMPNKLMQVFFYYLQKKSLLNV